MWKKTIIALTAIGLLTINSYAGSRHHDEVSAAIGGFVTGVVFSELIDNDTDIHFYKTGGNRGCRDGWDRYHSDYRDYNYGRKGRYHSHREYERDRYDRYDRHNGHRDRYHGSGHYIYEKRKIWIPGHWEYRRNHCGREIRVWVKGHYEYRRVKVWVKGRDHYRY